MCLDQHLFPDSFTIICSDCVSSTKSKGGGVLTAVLSKACTFKCRYELQFYHECIWVKISTQSSHSLLNGNDYLPPPPTPIPNRILFLNIFVLWRKILILKISVLLIGDSMFNAPNFDWKRSSPLSHCHFYSKLNGAANCTSMCLSDLMKCIVTYNSFDLFFVISFM
jgi:hypothetical protein